mmetsp:Transcript_23574/g.28991  ORF Transcript_23574/g.28991 Transcript_23574/m.28991 type:complete len:365 (-) Transcript_23574:220-1314(-)
MLADCMAMSVDAFTYLFNLVAERLKYDPPVFGQVDNMPIEEIIWRRKVTRLYLEFIPPLISVSVLILVTIQVMKDAVTTIMEDPFLRANDEDKNDEPNIDVMFLFSALNLVLDIVNMTCFAKAKNFSVSSLANYGIKLAGSPSHNELDDGTQSTEDDTDHMIRQVLLDAESGHSHEDDNLLKQYHTIGNLDKTNYGSQLLSTRSEDSALSLQDESSSESLVQHNDPESNIDNFDGISDGSQSDDDSCISEAPSETSRGLLNLNMCSAYTHVMADTLRSVTVLITAAVAYIFKGLDASIADAVAAMIVSIIIAISLGPLIVGLLETLREIQILYQQRTLFEAKKVDANDVWLEKYQNLPCGVEME